MPPNNNPVTNTTDITDSQPVTDTPVTNNTGVTTPIDKKEQNKKAKPKIDSLFVYDQSLGSEYPTALKNAYYKNAIIKSVSDWSDLVPVLSKYSVINTLIFDTHSIPGSLLLGHLVPTTSDQAARLKSSGVIVSGTIIFEGCEMMGDPVAASKLVEGIVGSQASVSGYTLYSVMMSISLELTGNEDAQGIETALAPHSIYLMSTGKTAKQLAGSKQNVTFYKRWFRRDLDETPVPSVAPGQFAPRAFIPHSDMTAKSVSNALQAKVVKDEFNSPVAPKFFVTVDNIGKVIK